LVSNLNPAKTEQVYKPNSVSRRSRDGDHSSRPVVAEWLKRPTRRSLSFDLKSQIWDLERHRAGNP